MKHVNYQKMTNFTFFENVSVNAPEMVNDVIQRFSGAWPHAVTGITINILTIVI